MKHQDLNPTASQGMKERKGSQQSSCSCGWFPLRLAEMSESSTTCQVSAGNAVQEAFILHWETWGCLDVVFSRWLHYLNLAASCGFKMCTE